MTHSRRRWTAGAGALAAGAAATAAAALAVRRVREVRPGLLTLAPEFRSPRWYLLHRPYDPGPPVRGSLPERLAARAARPGLGRPVALGESADGTAVDGFIYDPPGRARPSGALLWIHGGGMILGAPWVDHGLCNRLATELGAVVVNVGYRLAPEHPFPAGPDDCWAALVWLHEHADELGVDRARIGVAGASAGGGLTAAVAQMAHDRGLPLAFQGLVYPMLDDRTALRADHGTRGAVAWSPQKNRDAWGWYLGRPVGPDEDRPYAVPARREDLSGLAPAWVGVGDADLFHDEDLDYARRLEEAGVPVELDVVPGMPHAADMVPGIVPAAAFRDRFVAWLARQLA